MPIKDPDKRRALDRERHRKRVAARTEQGLCPRCGATPPAPGRAICGNCAEKKRLADRARAARRRAAGIPRHKDPDKARAAERRRYRRRTAQRLERGLCPKCGRSEPEPGRSLCASCAERQRRYDRDRYAAARVAGIAYGGKDPAVKRRSARQRTLRRRQIRRDRGFCIRCGLIAPVEGGASCEPCLEKRRIGERNTYARRRSAGCCVRCAAVTFEGAANCGPCAVVEAQKRESRNARARQRYAARRRRHRCVDCSRPAFGAARCEKCAKRKYEGSEHVRGMPLYAPDYSVVDAVTGEALESCESWEDVALYLSFEGLDFDDVEVLVERSPMATMTAAPWT